jgi:hypothetical protein
VTVGSIFLRCFSLAESLTVGAGDPVCFFRSDPFPRFSVWLSTTGSSVSRPAPLLLSCFPVGAPSSSLCLSFSPGAQVLVRFFSCCASVLEDSIPFPQEGVLGLERSFLRLICRLKFSQARAQLPAPEHQVRWHLLVLAVASAVFGSGSSARPDFLC